MFLLGDAILVAPVIEPGATTREVVLPPGPWVDWWTGELQAGTVVADAPLTRMPIWQRADRLVPMFARAADTLEPATAPGVTSYADPAYGRELALRAAGGGSATLHDGATGAVDGTSLSFTPGDQYDIVTFDLPGAITGVEVGGTPITEVTDRAGLAGCPAPGCFLDDATTGRTSVRLHGAVTAVVVP